MTGSERPFVDRPVTDTALAADVAARLAAELGLPAPAPLRVGMNALFAVGEVVIRVGAPTADPRLAYELTKRLTAAGIAVPEPASELAVHVGGLAATAWRRVEATGEPIDWSTVGRMVRAVHELPGETIPDGYPLPSPASFPWWHFDALIDEVGSEIDAAALAGLRAAIERNRGWDRFPPDTAVVCHGDVHPGNVMMTAGGPVLLDWDLMCVAPPGWDHAMLLTLAERWRGDPAVYPAFAAGYGTDLSDDPVALGLAELRNVAATLMRVRAARVNPAAREEADLRLRFWRGDPDAPQWNAQ